MPRLPVEWARRVADAVLGPDPRVAVAALLDEVVLDLEAQVFAATDARRRRELRFDYDDVRAYARRLREARDDE